METDAKSIVIHGKKISTTQLEIIGVADLVRSRRGEIECILNDLFRGSCDYAFANMKDLASGTSMILALDDKTADLLRDAPGIVWDGRLGTSTELKVRKQISVWISDHLIKV